MLVQAKPCTSVKHIFWCLQIQEDLTCALRVITALATLEKCHIVNQTEGTIQSEVSGLENLFIHESVCGS